MNTNCSRNDGFEFDQNFTDCLENDENNTFIVPPSDLVLRQQVYLYVVPTMILLCALGCIGNGAILMLIPWIRRPLFPVLKLSLGLAAADCWTSLLLGAGFVINSFLPYVLHIELGRQACISLVIETFRLGAILTSLLHLLLLAVNHYLAIALPAKLGHVLHTGTIAIAMTLFWVLPPAGFGISFATVEILK